MQGIKAVGIIPRSTWQVNSTYNYFDTNMPTMTLTHKKYCTQNSYLAKNSTSHKASKQRWFMPLKVTQT